jgi:hypothetical protein
MTASRINGIAANDAGKGQCATMVPGAELW